MKNPLQEIYMYLSNSYLLDVNILSSAAKIGAAILDSISSINNADQSLKVQRGPNIRKRNLYLSSVRIRAF